LKAAIEIWTIRYMYPDVSHIPDRRKTHILFPAKSHRLTGLAGEVQTPNESVNKAEMPASAPASRTDDKTLGV
jgi:hypothetical protein